MFLSIFLNKNSQNERPTPTDSGSNHSIDGLSRSPHRQQASDPKPALRPGWRRKKSPSINVSSSSQPPSILLSTSFNEGPKLEGRVSRIMLPPILPPVARSSSLTNFTTSPQSETTLAVSPVTNKLIGAWDAVKDDPKVTISRARERIGCSQFIGYSSTIC
jgi:hypothetical protein